MRIIMVWSWKKTICSIIGEALSGKEILFHVAISKCETYLGVSVAYWG